MPRYRRRVPTRFSDTDAMGHINNSVFLTYLEEGRVGLFDAGGPDGGPLVDGGLIVARHEVDYLRPLYVRPDGVDVEVWVERVGTRSFTLGCAVHQDGEVACRASTVLVAYDYAAGGSRPLSDRERARLSGHLPDAG